MKTARPLRLATLTIATCVVASAAPLVACHPSKEAPHTAVSASQSTSSSPSSSPSSSLSSSPSSSSVAKPAPVDPLASLGWHDLVLAEAWPQARRALDRLSAEEAKAPAAQLARARVLVESCVKADAEEAIAIVDAFVAATPSLRAPLAHVRTVGAYCAERWPEAIAGLSGSRKPRELRALARAHERAGDVKSARAALTTAIALTSEEARALSGSLLVERLRLDRLLADAASIEADRRSLFLEHPDAWSRAVAAGEPADAPVLTVEQWQRRAKVLAGMGRADESVSAIDAAEKLGLSATLAARARARALYDAKAYARAAPALEEVARTETGDDALDDAFHAARARSRGGDDASAIQRYDALASAHPSTRWGAEASYLSARLRFARATAKPAPDAWAETLAAYDTYVKGPSSSAPGQSRNVHEARRERSLALLEAGKFVEARKATLRLVDDAGRDGQAKTRLSLVAAIASERAGDKADAAARLRALIAQAPLSYVDMAARARLERLGEVPPAAPHGPIDLELLSPPSPPTPPWLLLGGGMQREAVDVLRGRALEGTLRAKCALLGAFEDAASAYSASIGADGTSAPRSDDAWAFRCAHPTPWMPMTDALERAHHLPRGLLHALLRQESAFRVDVVSGAGAVGVAQLMPATALATASQLPASLLAPIDVEDLHALQAPALQLSLAAAHLEALYRELLPATVASGGDASRLLDDDDARARATPLVIAAYNAGAGAVLRWLAEAGTLDADVFLERIPFTETRTYVARVLGNLAAYAVVHGEPLPKLPLKLRLP